MNKLSLHISRLIILTVMITGLNTSCNDALDEEVFSFISTTNYWQTEADAEAGVIGVYESFTNGDYYGRYWSEFTELPSDFVNINRNETFLAIDRWDLQANHPFVSQVWNIMYQQISRANGVIKFVPEIEMNEDKKSALIAEAKFIRAFDYFNIVRLWGAAPLAVDVVENKESASLAKSSVSDIYAQIEKDLQDAERDLPQSRPGGESGRVTSGAAKTLLAWVYLTQEKWTEASAKAKEVMGQYQLLPNFADVFNESNENNSEIIFSIQFDGIVKSNWLASFSHAGGTQNPNCFNGVRVYSVDNKSDIWTNWDSNQPRRNFTVYRYITGENGNQIDVGEDYPAFGKYNAPNETGLSNCYLNPIVLRYADVLLIFAEAESQAKNGPTSEAYEAINQVRRRAYGLPIDIPAPLIDLTGLNKESFRDAVIEERGYEFVMEHKRTFDLFRTGTFKEKLKAIGKPATSGDLFPIPQSEIDANPLINPEDQNPGY